ncbi:lipopolysaccharide biosynthesis protein [Mucilaginibacter sp. HD30]
MSTAKKFAGQTIIYGLSTIISRMIYFVLTPIYTRKISVAGNGVFTSLYSAASIVNAVLAFGMETTYFRYLQKREDNRQQVYNNSFGVILAVSVVVLLFSLLFLDGIVGYLVAGVEKDRADYTFYVKCFLFILLADAFCVIPFAKIRAESRPMRFAVVKLANIAFVMSFNLFFLFGVPFFINHGWLGAEWMASWYRPEWVGYVFLSNSAASVFTILLLLPEISKLRLSYDKSMLKEMLLYSWPVLVANLSFIINEALDKVLIKQLLPPDIGDEQAAIYGTCAKIAIFLNISIQAFRLGAEPFFFSHAKNKNAPDTYSRIMTYFIIAICVMSVAVMANIDLLATIILKPETSIIKGQTINNIYWEGLPVVPILLFGYISLGVYMNLSVWYKLSDQTKYGLYISGIGAIITIILNVIFIPKYSYMASAWTSLIAYSGMMILSYLWGQKHYPIPYNLKKSITYILSAVFLVYISFYVFNRNIFIGNGLLIAFASVALYFEWKNLKSIFIKS